MQAIVEKELPEREKLDLVVEIVEMFCKKGISFGQASEILTIAQEDLKKLPISEQSWRSDSDFLCDYSFRLLRTLLQTL